MSKKSDIFRQIINKYHLSEPVSSAHQKFILKSRKKNLKHILKIKGKYSLIFWAVLAINFFFRNFGFKLTFVQSKILLGLTTLTVTAGTTTGAYQGAKYVYEEIIQKDEPVVEENIEIDQEESLLEQIDKGKRITLPRNIPARNKTMQRLGNKSKSVSADVTTLEKENQKETPETDGKDSKSDPVTIIPSL